ncbi:MAG: hypothetical protein Q7U04_09820 [Bacteriovorax sp.]|nr:hypothetical protein [Bacteriovorax sp.]
MKKLTYSHYLAAALFTLVIVSCSSESKKQVSEKAYSSNTQKEFEAIEKNDLRSNPPYRANQRPATRPPVVIKGPSHEKKIQKENASESMPQITEAIDTSNLSAKNQERMQEINQNLAFFCMKHRKDRAFQDEESCLAYTKKILVGCEKKHKLINTIMVNCIKEQLKKRP